jgi:hypothetical protein
MVGRAQLDWLSVWLGFQREQASIRMQNGTQVIGGQTGTTVLNGLDSRYRTGWRAFWAGVEPAVPVGQAHVLVRMAVWFPVSYSGEGTWNLRTDLAQPLSFAHNAGGWGYEARLSYSRWLTHSVGLTLSAGHLRRIVRDGPDTTFLADGTAVRLTLRDVSLTRTGLGLEIAKSF